LILRSGYNFHYQLEKRIFWDFEGQPVTIWAT